MDKYYLVVYSPDGTIHLWPGDSQEACLAKLNKIVSNPQMKSRYKTATIIKRNLDNYADGLIFGSREYVDSYAQKIIKENEKNS